MARMLDVMNGKTPDRVPVSLMSGSYAAKMLEIECKEYFLNPEIAFDANKWLKKILKDDTGLGYSIPEGAGWDFGAELKILPGIKTTPIIERFPAINEAELVNLKVPDPRTAPAAQRELKFNKLKRENGMGGVSLALPSPFRQAVQLVPAELLMKWIKKRPDLVEFACNLSLEYELRLLDMYIDEFGVEAISAFTSYPMESHQLMAPKTFRNVTSKHAKKLHEEIMKRGVTRFTEHLCGNHVKNLWFWKEELDLPKHTLISIGTDTPPDVASEALGEDFVLCGYVNMTNLVLNTPDEIYEEARDIILKMKYRPGGFVLMTSCVVSNSVPPANLFAMLQAAEDFGYYDK